MVDKVSLVQHSSPFTSNFGCQYHSTSDTSFFVNLSPTLSQQLAASLNNTLKRQWALSARIAGQESNRNIPNIKEQC